MDAISRCATLAVVGCLLASCVEQTPARDEAEADATPAPTCPAGWVEGEDGCAPAPVDPAGCGPDRLTLADGTCGSAWACPEGWARAPGRIECLPPEPVECPEGSFWVPGGDGCTEARPCPEGWMRAYGGCMPAPLTTCDGEPLPGGGCLNLPPVQARGCDGVEGSPAPGEACRPLPVDGCSEGPFEAGAWPAGTVFVRAGAPDGDGSAERPLGTLRDALAAAGPAATVALGPGRYAAPTLTGTVTLQGRCARDVVLEGVLTAAPSAALTLVDLSVEGGVDVEANARATLSRVQVDGTPERPAVRIDGAVDATALRVTGQAEGVRVEVGGHLNCEDCVVDGALVTAIRVDAGAEASLVDTVVLRVTREFQDEERGFVHVEGRVDATGLTIIDADSYGYAGAIRVVDGEATLAHVRLAHADHGVIATAGAHVSLDDLDAHSVGCVGVWARGGEVRGSRWRIDGDANMSGCGGLASAEGGLLAVQQLDVRFRGPPLRFRSRGNASFRDARFDGRRANQQFVGDIARLHVERALFIDATAAVYGRGPSAATIRLSDVEWVRGGLLLASADVMVERLAVSHDDGHGIGLDVSDAATRLRDVFVQSAGLTVQARGGSIDADGITVVASPTAAPQTPPWAAGIEIVDCAGTLANVATTGTWFYGLAVTRYQAETPPDVRLRDVRVQGVRPDPYGNFIVGPKPAGVRVQGAAVTLDRLSVADVPGPGLVVGRGGTLTARRVALRDTGTEADDDFGRGGLVVTEGGSATIEDLDVRRALGFGVTVDAGDLTLARAHVSDLLPRADGPPPTAVLNLGGQLDIAGVAVTVDDGAAVVAQGGTLTLGDSALRGGGLAAVNEAMVDLERVAVRAGARPSVLAADGSRVNARDLLVADAAGGLAALSDAEVTLEDAVVDRPAGPGLAAHAATLTARNVGVTAPAGDSACAWATDGAQMTLDAARLRQCGGVGVGARDATLTATNMLLEEGAGDGAVCDGGALSLSTFRIARHTGAGVVARDCEATLADGWLVANGAAWATQPGGAVAAEHVARHDNETDATACAADCAPLPSPPTAPTAPLVEPLEDWPPPPWFGTADEDEK